MLKSLFESSIDKLHIPADMKDAIKQINNICLEAEDTSDNVKKSVEKVSKNQGMFNQHVSAEQAKAMYDAQQKENAAKSGGKPQTQVAKNDEPNAQKGTTKLKNDIMPKLIKEYGKDDPIITKLNDAIKLINDPKTLKEGSAKLRKEVYAQIIEDQGNNAPILQDIRDTIKIINTPDPKKEEPKKEEPKAEEPKAEEAKAEEPAENEETQQAQNDEGATEANTASEAQPAQTEETKAEEEQPAQTEEAQPAQNTEGNAAEPKAEEAKAEEPAQTEETNTAEAQPAQTEEAQPAQNTEGNAAEPKAEEAKAEEPAQTEETNTAEAQPAQTEEAQENKGVQIAKGATREPSQVRTSGPASGAQKPKLSFRPDVMTVQFYLQSIMPNSNLVADGLLGPKTISAIQQKEDIDVTGKMDGQTKQAFNMLLAEAKKKVIPMQEQLGVKADGLIGKQTLQAAKNANMNVTNAFSQNVKPTQQVASKKADVNVLDTPFDAAKADKDLANKQITQVEYNIWKSYGVSPEHQRNNPNEVRAQVSRLAKLSPSERRQQSQDVNVANSAQNTNQSNQNNQNNQKQLTGAEKFKPQNDEEKKFYDQTVQNYIKVYKYMGSSDEEAAKQADRVAKNHLVKFRNGTLPKAQMPKEMKPAVGAGNDKNVAEVAGSVKGPQNDAEKKFFDQTKENWTKVYAEKFKNNPERIIPAADQQARIELMKYRARMAQAARKNGQQQGAQQQVAQQQGGQQVAANGNTTPAQKAAPKQKQQKQGTQYYSGKVSYMHLPPDEKKVYDEAEKKSLDANLKWGKNEQLALDQAALDAGTAVLKYRAQKNGNPNG